MVGRSLVGTNRRLLATVVGVALMIMLFGWNLVADAATDDAEAAEIPGTDLSALESSDQEWNTKNQHRLWWNATTGTWDAVLPRSVASGASSASQWWIVKGVTTASPEYVTAVSSGPRDRPDVFWDGGRLYVLMSGGSSATLYRYDFVGNTYQPVGSPSTLPDFNTSEARAAIFKSSSGNLWASMMHGGGLFVTRSDDDGVSWSPRVRLMYPLDE